MLYCRLRLRKGGLVLPGWGLASRAQFPFSHSVLKRLLLFPETQVVLSTGRLSVVSTKSAARGAMPRPARAFRARTFPPSAAACALLLAAQCLWAQQDNPPPSKPRVSVVVTGVYEPLPLGEVDRPIVQLDIRNNELVSNSLEDFLRLDSSVDLQERGANGTQADVAMRGGTFEQTLILVDGFRMNDLQTGHHDMDLPFPVDSFNDVEVLHGAG